jgi:nitroimidazol reductase NimA-like FMN-containing flavoprotein (pyridoxamine 5'-phosphate oxidase superfamily)
MKIFNASPGFSDPLTEDEIVSFLVNQTHNIHLGTIDEKKDPNIHPTWYYYDPNKNTIYVETARNSKNSKYLK